MHSTPIASCRCPRNVWGISETAILLNSNDMGNSKWLAHFNWNSERKLVKLALSRWDLESMARKCIIRLSSWDMAAFKWKIPRLTADSSPHKTNRSGKLRPCVTSMIWWVTPSGRILEILFITSRKLYKNESLETSPCTDFLSARSNPAACILRLYKQYTFCDHWTFCFDWEVLFVRHLSWTAMWGIDERTGSSILGTLLKCESFWMILRGNVVLWVAKSTVVALRRIRKCWCI